MMKKIFLTIERAITRISEWGLLFSGILILIMSLLSTYGVGRRYIFNNPEPYSYELSTMLLLACVVFAVAGLQRQRRHLRVDFIAGRLSPRLEDILVNIFTPIMALFYVGIICWKSWDNAIYSMIIWETSQSSWEEPLFPVKMMVPIGTALLCLVLVSQLIQGIKNIIHPITRRS
ncbi:MAG: TRAP transporter small permease subunit [Deltaproteobacteria bacterium]|nr:TRAP transporter small permease subunit [Deltaproteobacteria bacterium]